MRHLFVINPAAGDTDHTREISEKIHGAMSKYDAEYEIFISYAPCSAIDYIKTAHAKYGNLRVYACGGDGTLNECVSGAAGLSGVSVTNYPCGTGNDFIRLFGDTQKFCELDELIPGKTVKIDVIKCNDRFAINVFSVGFDARIACEMQKFKRLPLLAKAAYNLSVIYNLFRGITRKYTIDIDGVSYTGKYTLIVACNGSYYGGGFNPVPEAVPNDGTLDFLIVRPATVLTVAKVIGKYAVGKYRELPELILPHKGKSLKITCFEPDNLEVDGEIFKDREISVEILPQYIDFIIPKSMEYNIIDIRRKQEIF